MGHLGKKKKEKKLGEFIFFLSVNSTIENAMFFLKKIWEKKFSKTFKTTKLRKKKGNTQ